MTRGPAEGLDVDVTEMPGVGMLIERLRPVVVGGADVSVTVSVTVTSAALVVVDVVEVGVLCVVVLELVDAPVVLLVVPAAPLRVKNDTTSVVSDSPSSATNVYGAKPSVWARG